MECCLIFIRSLLTCFHLFILASLFLSCAVLRSVTESISSSFETDLSMSSNEIKQVNLLSKAKVLSTPTYSRSKERKNLQGFCLLQMFLSGTYSEVGMPKSRDLFNLLLPGFFGNSNPGIFLSRDNWRLMIPGLKVSGFYPCSNGIFRDIPGFFFLDKTGDPPQWTFLGLK